MANAIALPCPVTCFCRSREGEGAILGQEYTHVENRHTEKRGNCTITAPDPLLSALARYGFDVELLAKLGNGRGGSFNAEALAIRVEDAARLFGPEVVAEPAVRPSASAPAGADPEPVAAPAVAVVPDSASVPASTPEPMAQQWSLKKPKRFPGYRLELRDFLEVARTAGNPEPPTVQDVLDAWNTCRPHGITRVMPDGFEYLDAKSKTKEADRDAIRKAIDRLVIRTTFGR